MYWKKKHLIKSYVNSSNVRCHSAISESWWRPRPVWALVNLMRNHNESYCAEIALFVLFKMYVFWSHGNLQFVLRFYGPVNPMGSCWARSVYLNTLLLGRLAVNQHCAHSFARKWQLPFLNQRKGETDQISTKNVAGLAGSNPQTPDHQLDMHPTKPPRPTAIYSKIMRSTMYRAIYSKIMNSNLHGNQYEILQNSN